MTFEINQKFNFQKKINTNNAQSQNFDLIFTQTIICLIWKPLTQNQIMGSKHSDVTMTMSFQQIEKPKETKRDRKSSPFRCSDRKRLTSRESHLIRGLSFCELTQRGSQTKGPFQSIIIIMRVLQKYRII